MVGTSYHLSYTYGATLSNSISMAAGTSATWRPGAVSRAESFRLYVRGQCQKDFTSDRVHLHSPHTERRETPSASPGAVAGTRAVGSVDRVPGLTLIFERPHPPSAAQSPRQADRYYFISLY